MWNMTDGWMSSVLSRFEAGKLIVVPLGILILVLGVLVVGNLLGWVEQSTASIVSSFTLVVVTAVYAYQTTKSV